MPTNACKKPKLKQAFYNYERLKRGQSPMVMTVGPTGRRPARWLNLYPLHQFLRTLTPGLKFQKELLRSDGWLIVPQGLGARAQLAPPGMIMSFFPSTTIITWVWWLSRATLFPLWWSRPLAVFLGGRWLGPYVVVFASCPTPGLRCCPNAWERKKKYASACRAGVIACLGQPRRGAMVERVGQTQEPLTKP